MVEDVTMRSLEHLAGALFGSNRAKKGTKYKVWKAFGEDAMLLLPLMVRDDAEAGSFEEYGISRDQPGANVRGTKAQRAETKWIRQKRGEGIAAESGKKNPDNPEGSNSVELLAEPERAGQSIHTKLERGGGEEGEADAGTSSDTYEYAI